MNTEQGITDLEHNPFSLDSWLKQGYGLTPHRESQIRPLFGKSVDEINNIENNEGKYPSFIGIRWGFAKVKNDILVPTDKWLNRIDYNEFGISKPKRNPPWSRDELILALDLYFRCPPLKTSKEHPEIIGLSNKLNALPIHPRKSDYETFRNPNGVYMKLCNYLRFDPNYKGEGLKAGSKLEKEIWDEFFDNKDNLRSVCEAILENANEVQDPVQIDFEDEEFEEGRILTRLHKFRERSPRVSAKKKQDVLNKFGTLKCEACGFDFEAKYGKLGKGFAECHHTTPVFKLKKGQKTKLSDLSILCANCHRIIHRSRPMITVSELKSSIININ